jgi:transcriptional regulator with XRE-family HTH domain
MMQESLARKLRVLRAERGITLQEAEELTGVTRETLGALEHGQRGAYTNTLQKIAKGYGITVGELLEEPVPLGKVPKVGRSEPAMERREYKEAKALDDSRYRELALGFLTRMPSDAERIEDLTRAAGMLEGYVRRWDAELEYLTEKDIYPYGKGIETGYLFRGIANALQKSLVPYAVWITKERSEEVSESELAASRRLLDAVKSMDSFVEWTRDKERQMRSDQGEVLAAELESMLAELESMLAYESTG